MDLYAALASPVQVVFWHLADPSRLSDWLVDVAHAAADPVPVETGTAFALTVRLGTVEVAATGEITAFEPPWLVGYRLFAGSRTLGLRVTCSALAGMARLHVHQPDEDMPLTVDLAGLERALGSPPQPPAQGESTPAAEPTGGLAGGRSGTLAAGPDQRGGLEPLLDRPGKKPLRCANGS